MQNTSVAIALSALSFMLSVIWGPPLLRVLIHFKVGKLIRIEEPKSHLIKMGTPTMGGVMIVLPVVLLTVLLNGAEVIGFRNIARAGLLPVFALVAYAVLGAVDDWEGIRGPRRGLGMRARTKLILQTILAGGIAFFLYFYACPAHLFWSPTLTTFNLGLWYIPIAMFIIVGMSNAVNFTDGLDGLAGLISAMGFIAYGIIALVQDQPLVAQFCFIMVGALFGFLWFNMHPAALIMGDCGALALGACLGLVALLTSQWLILPLIAIIPVSEAFSVTLQIGYFKLTHGKRIFRMAPMHYHFELGGWSETQVVQRFWLISLLFVLFGVAIAIM